MTFSEKLLRHHDHPAKVAADASAAIIAGVLLWQQHLARAAVVGVAVPSIASACVLWFADFGCHRAPSSRVRVSTWMSTMVRLAGVFVFWGGAWYRSAALCLAGLAVVALTWLRLNPSSEPDRALQVSASVRRQFARFSRALERQQHLVALALLLLGMTDVVIFYLAGHPFRSYLIENSDLLYLPTLFSDLLSRGGRLSDWFLTPAPYFFPDYPIYFFAHA